VRRPADTTGRPARWFLPAVCVVIAAACGASAASDSAAAPKAVGDTISGALPKVVVASKGPYVVVADIWVPQGKTVIIEPGAVFLFHSFAGLKVQGTLLARGSADRPIVFTSINDRTYNPSSVLDPAPYDWNGIYIHEEGTGSNLGYCAVTYSVYGIISLTRFVRIAPCVFGSNGRANLTIEGTEHQVGEGPYEYSLTVQDVQSQGVPLTILRDPVATRRNAVRYGSVALFAGGVVCAAVATTSYAGSKDRFDALSGTDPDNLAGNSGAAWETARGDVVGSLAFMIVGYTLSLAGAAGFSWTFTF